MVIYIPDPKVAVVRQNAAALKQVLCCGQWKHFHRAAALSFRSVLFWLLSLYVLFYCVV